MRLTLRTMLAYLDGILDPADRDEIAQKIDESEFARQLVQRLRDCLRNPQLPAPKVSGKTMGLDPNLVAEYLDNTLAGERVPEFEKLCLESDVFLAEVAACHQILTMVLAQPADIDFEMKQSMYGVLNQADSSAPESVPAGAATGDHAPALPDDIWVKPGRRKLEVPDYLRETPRRSNWKPIAAVVLLVLILGLAITMALGPLDRTHPIARLLGFGQPAENPANAVATEDHGHAAETHTAATEQNSATDHNASQATSAGPAQPEQNDASGASKPPQTNVVAAPATAGNSNTANPATADKPAVDTTASDVKPTAEGANPAGNLAVAGATVANGVAPPAATTAPLPAEAVVPAPDSTRTPPPIPEPPANATTTPPSTPDASHVASTEVPRVAPVTTGSPPPPGDTTVPVVDNTPLGRLLPGKDVVLLKFDAASGQYSRVPPGAAVTAGEQLLVLPTYRPTITLSAGITLQIPEETLLQLQSTAGQGFPTVKLIYGRLVAITSGKAGGQLGLDAGGIKGVVTFTDAEATLGVEVRRFYSPGVNPEAEEPRVAADLYAARGHLEWTDFSKTTALFGPQRWELSGDQTTAVGPADAPTMPKWIDPEQLRPFDAQASEFLAQSLSDDKPLPVALGEMVNHRRVEIKSLGAQCLALLDDFEPLVETFNDPDQRPMWSVDITSVKAAIARGSATAAKVHVAFVKQRGDDLGKELYRMFLGYTKEQLQNGEAAKLVDFLDHDNLDCRVLAFANLQEITNKTFNYRPEAPAASRAQPLRRWQEELHSGAIAPRDNPQK